MFFVVDLNMYSLILKRWEATTLSLAEALSELAWGLQPLCPPGEQHRRSGSSRNPKSAG